jgi:3-hydroxyacyl-[acyl-carrier-protein] dehydratase
MNGNGSTHAAGEVLSFDGHQMRRLMPHRHHMMLLDRVPAYYRAESRVVAIKNVSQNDPIVRGHFPEYPVFPGSLLIEGMAQASGLLMNIEYLRKHGGVDIARLADPTFTDPVEIPMTVLVDSKVRQLAVAFPGDQVQLRSQLAFGHGEMCQFQVAAWVGEREIARGEIMLAYAPYMS